MKKILSILLLTPWVASAALSPFYQSIMEIKAILDDENLEEELGQATMIESITKNETGYLIKNGEGHVQVHLHYNYSGKIGPANFTLEFEKSVENGQP